MGVMNMDSAQAESTLKRIGFLLHREGKHRVYKRGTAIISLSKTSSDAVQPSIASLVSRLAAEWEEKEKAEGRLKEVLPIQVEFQSTIYAVVRATRTGQHYVLKSLVDGTVTTATKEECNPVDITIPKEVEPMPELTVRKDVWAEETPAEVDPTPVHAPLTPLNNNSDLAALIRLTQRRMESLKLERDILLNKMGVVEDQYQASINMLRSLHVEVEEYMPPYPRRTILPPTYPGRGGKSPKVDHATKDRIRMVWIDMGRKPSLKDLKARLVKEGIELPQVTDSWWYLATKEFRDGEK
jgi:hypothetical protein